MGPDKIDADSIREGMDRHEFFLEYLPSISLEDGRCVGAEALTRWRRPTGVVSPGEFIPILEETQLSGRITYWVVDTIALELGTWLREHPDASISINVPPEIVGRGGIEHAAMKAGIGDLKSQLVLEITERGVPDAIAVQALAEFAKAGVRVALDDVMLPGGANLAILSRIQFASVKLDRALIGLITPECPMPEWLKGIASLLKTSDVVAIAEGVETKFQADVLREAGVQAVQGFYFSRPLPAADFIAFHASTQRTRPEGEGRPGP